MKGYLPVHPGLWILGNIRMIHVPLFISPHMVSRVVQYGLWS